MAISSMTGFGKAEVEKDGLQVSVEVKSVNHRFKDFRFKMGNALNPLEIDFRKKLQESFKRGSFDIFINYKKEAKEQRFNNLDEDLIKEFVLKMKNISDQTGAEISIRPVDFLKNEFMKEDNAEESELLFELANEAFSKAIVELSSARSEEGEKLIGFIKDHRTKYEEYFKTIEENSKSYEKEVKERIIAKFEEYGEKIDTTEQRFMQEVIYYMEKLDIAEEINRIKAHLNKLDKLLESKGEVGRQIDFMVQELNRETNTIGSKSSLTIISESVIQMKVQLEKMREQGLNLE